MDGKIFVLLCTLASLGQVYPNPLTKEINADQSLLLKFRDVLVQLDETDVVGKTISSVVTKFEDIYSDITDLIQSRSDPDVLEVLDIFNIAFGERLLVEDQKYIHVDPVALERFVLDNARSAVQNLFPNDFLQQFVIYGALQHQIQIVMQELLPEIDNVKVSLDEITARIALDLQKGHPDIETRATDMITALETTICDTLVSTAYSQLNETLSAVTKFLTTLQITDSNNGAPSLVTNLVSFGVDLAKQVIARLWKLAESFQSSVCSIFLSPTERVVDLTSFKDLVDRTKRDTALVETEPQVLATRSGTVILSVLGTILSFALTAVVNTIVTSIISYLINTIAVWFYRLINSMF